MSKKARAARKRPRRVSEERLAQLQAHARMVAESRRKPPRVRVMVDKELNDLAVDRFGSIDDALKDALHL